jgi:hypothetical protein
MTKSEWRKNDEARMTNRLTGGELPFGIRHSALEIF